jgi:uncharacterized protein (TIGR00730 family)
MPDSTTSAPLGSSEVALLEGPEPRTGGLKQAIRTVFDMVRGFRALHFVGPCVTVFGSARFPETHRYYDLARQVGLELAKAGFTVMTGGGPGVMEAASRGAKEGGGPTVGCTIQLPTEVAVSPYLDTTVEFRYFFIRKVMLVKYSFAFVALPGGFGTLDEVFEAATLIQTGKIKDFPIVLMGSSFWGPMLAFMRDTLVREGTIDLADLERLIVTDSPVEAARLIRDTAISRFGVRYAERPKRRRILFE